MEKVKDAPHEEADLVALATVLLELEVVNCPTALVLREVSEEVIVRRIVGLLRHDNLRLVCGDLVDDVFELLAELELLERLQAGVVDGYTGHSRLHVDKSDRSDYGHRK